MIGYSDVFLYTDVPEETRTEAPVEEVAATSDPEESLAKLADRFVALGDFYFREARFAEAAEAYARARTYAPDDATILARSELCANQAMRVGRHAWSMQYHVEVEPDTVDNWGKVPAYKQALESTLGADALGRLKADADGQMTGFVESAATLYRNFRAAVNSTVK